MRNIKPIKVITPVILLLLGVSLMAIEEAKFRTIQKDGPFELRQYEKYLLAETIIAGDMEDASSRAFRRLFNYISGENRSQSKVAMTAPVSQQAAGQKISMTTPVSQEPMEDAWGISFMIPNTFTEETVPIPNDDRVKIRVVPGRQMATIQYSGRWSRAQFMKNKHKLEEWIQSEGLIVTGEAIWARFNAPYTPWFMRRNEVQIPVIRPEVQPEQG